MYDFFVNGPGLVLLAFLFAFFWLPFALGAYVTDIWLPRHRARRSRAVAEPARHIPPNRPAEPTMV